MDITELLGNALKVSVNVNYKVVLGDEIKEMTYLELGMFLVNNAKEIEKIKIIMRD